jgi:DNA-directed RNA polymerase subunit RPC12/RpoP
MGKREIACECGHKFTISETEHNSLTRCPQCGVRIYLEEEREEKFLLVPVSYRKGIFSSIDGNLAITSDSISFIGPARHHPLHSGPPAAFEGPIAGAERKDYNAFVDSRKGKRSLYEQISESEDIEKKIKDLAKYRAGSVVVPKSGIRGVQYYGGVKLIVIGQKAKYSFKILKQDCEKVGAILKKSGYIV